MTQDSNDTTTRDLFELTEPASSPEAEHIIPPSEGVFIDNGDELVHIGEVQIPRPMPVELIVEIDGFDYYFKLSERRKSQ